MEQSAERVDGVGKDVDVFEQKEYADNQADACGHDDPLLTLRSALLLHQSGAHVGDKGAEEKIIKDPPTVQQEEHGAEQQQENPPDLFRTEIEDKDGERQKYEEIDGCNGHSAASFVKKPTRSFPLQTFCPSVLKISNFKTMV